MISHILCFMLGGLVGLTATALCAASGKADAYQEGFRAGKDDACSKRKCMAWERLVERGE